MFEPNLVIKKVRVVDSEIFCYAYGKVIGVTFLRKKLMKLVAEYFGQVVCHFELVE